MLKQYLQKALTLNIKLKKSKLSFFNFGNASIKYKNFCFIKPSGINPLKMKFSDISIVNINNRQLISGKKPSVDLNIHLRIYENFDDINSIVHTHSKFATSWAQSLKPIPCYGTTHADFFNKVIPTTSVLSKRQVENDYETNIGNSIINKIKKLKINPLDIPGILIANHGIFSWGGDKYFKDAFKNALIIEYISELAFNSKIINPRIKKISKFLQNKHFFRKHGRSKYYGQ